jgi:hypothetical protein
MKKLLAIAALTLALVAGPAAVMTVHQQAIVCAASDC